MNEYFAALEQKAAEELQTAETCGGNIFEEKEHLFAAAIAGNVDAVFAYAKHVVNTRFEKIPEKELSKLYKKLGKYSKKLDGAKTEADIYKVMKKMPLKEKDSPRGQYLIAQSFKRIGKYMYNASAIDGGDPEAIANGQKYFSTNGVIADEYTARILYKGKFDIEAFLDYSIRGIGIDYSPYYPNSYTPMPGAKYGVSIHYIHRHAYRLFLETLEYFADSDKLGTDEYKARFGDYVPDGETVLIAQHWFFVDDDRLVPDDDVLEFREKVAAKLRERLAGSKKKPAKKAQTVDAPRGTAEERKPEKKASAPTAPKKSTATPQRAAAEGAKTEFRRQEFASGDVYEGEFVGSERHGQGTYTSRKGWVAVGQFAHDNIADGKVTFTESGSTYEGHFENGGLHGKGKATYYVKENGKYVYDGTYEGDWVKAKREGKGKRVYYDGSVYEGDWVDDKRNGYGRVEHYTDKWQTKHFSDLVYEGQWKDDKKHGKGVEKHYMPGVNQDVTVYEGEWVNGKREGIFVWYLFYPAVGRQSSKEMRYYQNGEAVFDSIPYDASIKTYEDFAAANDPYNERLYRELYELKQTGKAYTPRFANLSAQLHSKENIEAIASKIMRQNDMSKVSMEDAEFVLFLYNKFVKQGANHKYWGWCHYRLGDYKKAAGCLIGEAMAYSYLKKAERKRESWQICLNRNSRNADYYKELAIDRIGHARAELEAAKKTPMRYQADSIRAQIEDVELQLGMW